MTAALPSLTALIGETIRDPRGAARRIIAQGFRAAPMWEALGLVIVLSVLAGYVPMAMVGASDDATAAILPEVLTSPIALALVQGALLVLAALATHRIGRGFGGRGNLSDAIALVAWLQFLMVCLQVVQAVLMFVLPPVAALIGVAGVVVFFYFLTQFVCELHGFTRPGMVFVGIVVSMLSIITLLSILLGLLGLGQLEMVHV